MHGAPVFSVPHKNQQSIIDAFNTIGVSVSVVTDSCIDGRNINTTIELVSPASGIGYDRYEIQMSVTRLANAVGHYMLEGNYSFAFLYYTPLWGLRKLLAMDDADFEDFILELWPIIMQN